MPLYSYICECCEKRDRRFLPVSRYKDPQYCHNPICPQHVVFDDQPIPEDRQPMTKIIEAPAVVGDYEGYISPATGKWVEGRKQHLEDLKRSGCRIYEPGETDAEIRKTAERQARVEKEIDDAVERTAAELGIN